MTGLLDQYLLLGDELALSIAQKMGDYFVQRIDSVIAAKGDAHWQVRLQDCSGLLGDQCWTRFAK